MEENSNYLNICLTCENYYQFVTMLLEKANDCDDKTKTFAFRRAAGLISNHFRTDYLSPFVNTKGLDKHDLLPVFLRADVEVSEEKIAVDLIIIADDGNGYDIFETRGIYEILTPQELAERSIKARRKRKDEHT
jgi:hypothetical protein